MEKNKDKTNTKIERVEGICLKIYILVEGNKQQRE